MKPVKLVSRHPGLELSIPTKTELLVRHPLYNCSICRTYVYRCNLYLSSGRLGVILQGRLVNIPKTEVTVTEASKNKWMVVRVIDMERIQGHEVLNIVVINGGWPWV
jgi:hypothetical protein